MKNRYGDQYQFELVRTNVYKITGDLKYWRFGGTEAGIDYDNLGFVDPSGGPFISQGYPIDGKRVTRIFCEGNNIMFEVQP